MPATSERNEKLKAAMRDENTGNLNTSGKMASSCDHLANVAGLSARQDISSLEPAERANWRHQD